MVDLGAPVLQLASARGSPGIRAPFTELGVTQTGSHRSGGHTVPSTQAGNKQGKKIKNHDRDFAEALSVPHFPSTEA